MSPIASNAHSTSIKFDVSLICLNANRVPIATGARKFLAMQIDKKKHANKNTFTTKRKRANKR